MRAGLNFQKEVRSDNHKEAIEPKGMMSAIYERVNFKLKDRKKELQRNSFLLDLAEFNPSITKSQIILPLKSIRLTKWT